MRINIALEDYDYRLPKELIAKYPPRRREESRLLVLERKSGKIYHRFFYQIIEYLKPGDILVRNVSRVVPARITGFRETTGGKIEILFLEIFSHPDSLFPALVKCRGKLKEGEKILLPGERMVIYCGKERGIHKFKFDSRDLFSYLYEYGRVPLPPYIKRKEEEEDKERYQTVYARKAGSVAAPTAGLHFSKKLLKKIEKKGVKFVDLTLHISYATFKSLTERELCSGRLYKEYFEVSPDSAKEINEARREGKRVIAIGTTSVRVLEAQAFYREGQGAKVREGKGWTDLFIYPGYKFQIVDALITNFHLPRTSLLLLVSAFAGRKFLFLAYEEAIRRGYRFYSYGDCMLII